MGIEVCDTLVIPIDVLLTSPSSAHANISKKSDTSTVGALDLEDFGDDMDSEDELE